MRNLHPAVPWHEEVRATLGPEPIRERSWNRRSAVSSLCNASRSCRLASSICSLPSESRSAVLIANLMRSIATRAWYANSNSIAVGQDCTLASIIDRMSLIVPEFLNTCGAAIRFVWRSFPPRHYFGRQARAPRQMLFVPGPHRRRNAYSLLLPRLHISCKQEMKDTYGTSFSF